MQRPKQNRRPEAHIEQMPHEWLRFNKFKPMQQTELELENDRRKTNNGR